MSRESDNHQHNTKPLPARGFDGFPAGKVGRVLIPEPFFSELLPLIDDLNELKVTIYCFWALHQREGDIRYLRQRDLYADEVLCAGLGAEPHTALDAALARAVARGTLLSVEVPGRAGDDTILFINTAKGRKALEALVRGDWQPGTTDRPVALVGDRPTIFALYEENIGPLTPLIADTLRDAESTYRYEWIAEAIRAGVEHNKRNWRYVEAILKRWATEGRTDRGERGGKSPDSSSGSDDPYLRNPYFKRRTDGNDSQSG